MGYAERNGSMEQLFQLMIEHLRKGENLVLVTVVASSGATPRGAGARMLVGKSGRLAGTIGGGAVEYRSEQIAQEVLHSRSSRGHSFTLTKEDVQNLGMICGGACSVFFCYLPAADAQSIAVAEKGLEHIRNGRSLWLISDLTRAGKLGLYSPEEGFFQVAQPQEVRPYLTRHPIYFHQEDREFYTEQINSCGRVYIFGGGHVAQELVPVLSRVGFRCVVMDDRPEFAKQERFPQAQQVILGDFGSISDYITLTQEDYVCVMTRGHAADTLVQAQVLPCRPCYVGVIGSRQKAAGVRKRLKEEFGLSEQLLNLVTTPIGLEIKSETPAEIAISIAAQMILCRAERSGL